MDLKSIDFRRNLITHDYLRVLPDYSYIEKTDKDIERTELVDGALSVLRLAKMAIMYTVNSISMSEAKKPSARTVPWEYRHHHGEFSDTLLL